jgi:hypothetical protein
MGLLRYWHIIFDVKFLGFNKSYPKRRPVYISKHNVSETGFYLHPQVKPTQLGSIDRASPYLRRFRQRQDDGQCPPPKVIFVSMYHRHSSSIRKLLRTSFAFKKVMIFIYVNETSFFTKAR